jgi:hypothetical protein
MSSAGRFAHASGTRPGGGPAPLGEIGIAGLSRARVGLIAGVIVLGWLAVGFVGQAGDTTRAAARATAAQGVKASLQEQVAALQSEVALVAEPRWIIQQARTFDLKTAKETPIVLAPGAPELPADAPGSAARRVGTETEQVSPLDRWLEILFGSSR